MVYVECECGVVYEKGSTHFCIAKEAIQWVQCDKCPDRYPVGSPHKCSKLMSHG